MSFYWVNLGTSFKEVDKYRFLWAPAYTLQANGKKAVDSGWKHVPEVKKGDVVFCHKNGEIIYIAVAKTDAYPSIRPESRTFNKWKSEGFKIDVDLEVLNTPINTKDFKDALIRLYNDRCSPKLFSVEQQATQNYMISIPDGAGALLLDAIGEISLAIQAKVNDSSPSNNPTEREAIVKSRIGQGKFRDGVFKVWGGICPVTNIDIPELLIASHILPWQLSNDNEKLDKFNGLPLSPSIDKLFDKGYVSFSDKGCLLVSENLPDYVLERLGINSEIKLAGLKKEHLYYLERHREIFGF